MLFNFQGPCTFYKFFICFSSALFILPHSKAFVKTFFKLFQKVFELFEKVWKKFLSFLWICNPEINLCFTHFLLFSWLKNRLNTGFFKPLLFKFFTALSRQLHYITTLCEECQHFFWIFFVFLTIFLFSLFLTYI